MITEIQESSNGKIPIAFVLCGGIKIATVINNLRTVGICIYDEVDTAARCLSRLYIERKNAKERASVSNTTVCPNEDLNVEKINSIVSNAQSELRPFLHNEEATEIMKILGINMPETSTFDTKDLQGAAKFAEEIGYPIVLKITSDNITHKTDVGGVITGIKDASVLIEAWNQLPITVRKKQPDAIINGFEVSKMVPRNGIEIIIGAKRDDIFGPVITFGTGGIYTEVDKDSCSRALPVYGQEIENMIASTKVFQKLSGLRGRLPADMTRIIQSIINIGTVIHQVSGISDIEINPLFAYHDDLIGVDARIIINRPN